MCVNVRVLMETNMSHDKNVGRKSDEMKKNRIEKPKELYKNTYMAYIMWRFYIKHCD